jgi:undecaprenyl phosphate-alpha-L-ara4N flippase subunit ArnE
MPKSPGTASRLRLEKRLALLSGKRSPRPRQQDETAFPGREETPRRRPLTIGTLALLLFAVAAAAVGQVMLKHGMHVATTRVAATRAPLALAAATSPWVLLGLVVFAVSATAWLATLSRVPLSVAYPFNALGYLGILTASVVFLHERTNAWTWVGTLLVVSGLIIVVLTRA